MSYRVFGQGRYHTGERDMLQTYAGGTAGTRLIVLCHGTAANGWWYAPPSFRVDLEGVVRRGFTVASVDHGNALKPDNWGNDTSIARVDEVITWATNELGCNTTQVGIIGDSAGGATALGWSWRNPTRVGACILRGGVVDIGEIYATGNLILVPLIDAAYDNTWPAQQPTHDPILNTALCVPIRDRIMLLYSTGDGLVSASSQEQFAEAVGCRATPVGDMDHGGVGAAVNGHLEGQFMADRVAA